MKAIKRLIRKLLSLFVRDYVIINGLKWDKENLVVDGKTHFAYKEALQAAASVGKRLPTREEYKALLALSWHWSEADRGIWVANDQLFFPASGCRDYNDGTLRVSGTYGYGWSSTPYDGSNAWFLDFWSTNARTNYSSRRYGFPVRCVQDKNSR
ncbi:MAG: DUF1566 domain-containing protein [Parabacteroides sp.]|nr:DUF1566 domain-containing protein [Parabacteroides sp.]